MVKRIGFVGVGGIAQAHLENVASYADAETVAVCDVNSEAVRKTSEKYQTAGYTDFEQMLKNERLDALFMCVPPFAHGNMEEQAALEGIHLFVEKPLGLDMETVRYKNQMIQESGIITSTGYCLRYLDIVQEAKEYLKNRTIALVNGYYLTKFVTTPWWREMEKSGGQLVEQSTHTMDLIRYLAGDISSVQAFMNLVVSKNIERLDIFDVGTVNLAFSSGAVGNLSTTFIQHDHRSGVEILGENFRVHIDGTTLSIAEEGQTIIKNSKVDFYKEQDTCFLQAISTGDRTKILAPYAEALKTLEVTLAANQSAKNGSIIQLNSYENVLETHTY